MKKISLINLTGVALLTLGLGETVQNTNVSQAATVYVGKKQKLTHNSYVYNFKGKRISGIINKGTFFKIRSIKKINGKKYAQIGKNEYIKLVNFNGKNTKKPTGWLNRNSYVYNNKGMRISKKTLKFGHNVTILGNKTIKGHKYIQIGKNKFIRATNVTYFDDAPEKTLTNENSNVNVRSQVNNTNQSTTSSVINSNPNNSITGSVSSQNVGVNNSNSASNEKNALNQNNQSVDENNDANTNDFYLDDTTALHNSYTYDENGNRNLGGFIVKDKKYNLHGKKTINGKRYYGYEHSIYDGNFIKEYVPASAFEKDGKDQKFNSAPIKEIVKFKQSIEQYSVDYHKVELSSAYKRKALQKAELIMHRVAESRWSSKNDIDIARKNYENAVRDLDGKPIIVKGNWNNFSLTEKQRNKIISLANKFFGTDDATLSDDGRIIYYSSSWDEPSTAPVSQFVEFAD